MDYDGDSVSIKPVLLKEGVETANKIQKNPLFNFDYVGNFRRGIGKDGAQSLFTFTRDPIPSDKSKEIKESHDFIKYLLSDQPLDLKVLYAYCASFDPNKKPELSLYDTVTITLNKKKYKTTVGRIVLFKAIFGHIWKHPQFEFRNSVIYDDTFSEIIRNVMYLQIEKKVPDTSLNEAVSRYGEFVLRASTVFNPSCTYEMLNPDKEFVDFRNKVFDEKTVSKIKEEGDIKLLEEKEKEVIDYAKKKFKDDDMYELYISKNKAKWDNDFKAMHVGMGALPSITGGKASIITTPLSDGMKIEDIPALIRTGAMGKVHTSAPSLW